MNKSALRLLRIAVLGVVVAGCDLPGAAPSKSAGATAKPAGSSDLTKRQRDVMDSAKQVQSVVDAGEEARRKQLDAAESK